MGLVLLEMYCCSMIADFRICFEGKLKKGNSSHWEEPGAVRPLVHMAWMEKWPELSSYIASWAMANSVVVKLRKLKETMKKRSIMYNEYIFGCKTI